MEVASRWMRSGAQFSFFLVSLLMFVNEALAPGTFFVWCKPGRPMCSPGPCSCESLSRLAEDKAEGGGAAGHGRDDGHGRRAGWVGTGALGRVGSQGWR